MCSITAGVIVMADSHAVSALKEVRIKLAAADLSF